jgi:hypothetical protein
MGNPDAAAVIRAFAGIAIITALGQIPSKVCCADRMQFRRIAVITAVAAVVTAAVLGGGRPLRPDLLGPGARYRGG